MTDKRTGPDTAVKIPGEVFEKVREAGSQSTGGRTGPRSFRRDESEHSCSGLADLGAGRMRGLQSEASVSSDTSVKPEVRC